MLSLLLGEGYAYPTDDASWGKFVRYFPRLVLAPSYIPLCRFTILPRFPS